MKSVVIIPAYNESQKIYHVVQSVVNRGYDVVVVDDGSGDNTAHEARRAGAVVLSHCINRGYGAALTTGNGWAYRNNYDIAVHFDADGQHNPDEIENITAPIQKREADIVIGSRFIESDANGANNTRMARMRIPIVRKILIRLATKFTRVVSGIQLTDAHNGFRALSREALGKINCMQDGMSYASEVVDQIAEHGWRYKEVPNTIVYTQYSRQKGESNVKKILLGVRFLWGKVIK